MGRKYGTVIKNNSGGGVGNLPDIVQGKKPSTKVTFKLRTEE